MRGARFEVAPPVAARRDRDPHGPATIRLPKRKQEPPRKARHETTSASENPHLTRSFIARVACRGRTAGMSLLRRGIEGVCADLWGPLRARKWPAQSRCEASRPWEEGGAKPRPARLRNNRYICSSPSRRRRSRKAVRPARSGPWPRPARQARLARQAGLRRLSGGNRMGDAGGSAGCPDDGPLNMVPVRRVPMTDMGVGGDRRELNGDQQDRRSNHSQQCSGQRSCAISYYMIRAKGTTNEIAVNAS